MFGRRLSRTDKGRVMGLDVIGAGFGRTGTLSLKLALEQLGFSQCYHMFEVMNHPEHVPLWRAAHRGESIDWEALFTGYRAAVDWPTCNFWRKETGTELSVVPISLTTKISRFSALTDSNVIENTISNGNFESLPLCS